LPRLVVGIFFFFAVKRDELYFYAKVGDMSEVWVIWGEVVLGKALFK